jgi:Rad3-related DNA helicase
VLENNTIGFGNTGVGSEALLNKTTGDQNTAIGYFSGSNITSGTNNITIGYNAQVPNNAGNNQIRLGNASISYAGIQVGWTITSDRRWKENIEPSNLGLGFISKLNPVSYTRINDENHRTEYGLIAQEVEEVLKECGLADKTGMLTVTVEGMYELRYNDLIATMIKAMQELKIQNEELSEGLHSEKIKNANEITKLTEENLKLQSELKSLSSIKEDISRIESLKEELIQQINELKSIRKEYENKFSSLEN